MTSMDENRPAFRLKAPGSSDSGSSMRLPGRNSFPGVDDHLVKPEVTRDEIIGGRRVVAQPAEPPHARGHFVVNYALQAYLPSGYLGAVDLLTRHGPDSDFATDACAYKDGIDPETGDRYLEEIAFEVVSEQRMKDVTEKAEVMHRRGVRRIFAIFVKGNPRVCEWSPERQTWRTLDRDSMIEDPCLVRPLAVSALLDAAIADNAVAEALIAKGNPVIQKQVDLARSEGKEEGREEGREKGRAEGEAKGQAKAIVIFLEARGLSVSPTQQQEILSCSDIARLNRWLYRASVASSTNEVLSEP
jgi:hypothetical protein